MLRTVLTSEEKIAGNFFLKKYREKYQISELENGTNYRAFLVGNAPVIEGLAKYRRPGHMAVVGLSGFRSLLIACQLSENESVPHLFIVDSSNYVCELWSNFIKFLTANPSQKDFRINFPLFLENHKSIYRNITCSHVPGVHYPAQDIILFFENLFAAHNYCFVREIVVRTKIIKQTWLDTNTFIKIRHILALRNVENVYVFASNIISFVNVHSDSSQKDMLRILTNIQYLKPKLVIHADLSTRYLKPTRIFLIENTHPIEVLKIIFNELPPVIASANEEKSTPEEKAQQIIQNIKFNIHWTPWITKSFFNKTVFGKIPAHVKKQLNFISKAEKKDMSYLTALDLLKKEGVKANETKHSRRDKLFTEPYYATFESTEKFERKFGQ